MKLERLMGPILEKIWNFFACSLIVILGIEMTAILLAVLSLGFATGKSIWEVGREIGSLPSLDLASTSPIEFYKMLFHKAFVVRKFHDTLDMMAEGEEYVGDSVSWFESLMNDDRIDSIEGELWETRLAPVMHKAKWKYFIEKYKDMDIYAVTRAPKGLRPFLKLMPIFSCGGQLRHMAPPNVWVSGGIRSSKSVVHSDSQFNQHCVLKGSKSFLLIPPFIDIQTPEYGWVVIDGENGPPEGLADAYGEYAEIDPDNIDLDKHPGWRDVPWFRADLEAGDCIYMPLNWYHYVESKPELTITWHNWFDLPPTWVDTDTCFGKNKTEGVTVPTSQCIYDEDYEPVHLTLINSTSQCDI